jgi:D-3-phosphoglycerate dehydrogenase
MAKYQILVADPISDKGIELLQSEPSFDVVVNLGLKQEVDFAAAAVGAHAIIVRSGVKVTAKVIEAAPNLKVVRESAWTTSTFLPPASAVSSS